MTAFAPAPSDGVRPNRRTGLCALAAVAAVFGAVTFASSASAAPASLRVEGEVFVLTLPGGHRLTSTDLIGAELETQDGQTIRIDAVTPARERPKVLLHSFSVLDPATRTWTPLCDADAYGRRAGMPVAGRWDADGRFVKDPDKWFLACSGGSRAKCVLWGYDPWGRGPHGEDLAAFYQTCQFTVRANYDGQGEAHTRNGTTVDVSDVLGIETSDTLKDNRFIFEAGWGPTGAVCVARTRWPELLSLQALLKASPRLGGPCDEAEARRRGALIFTRVMDTPVISPPKI